GRTGIVATAGSCRPVELPQKSTSGSPWAVTPTRTPRTAPVRRHSSLFFSVASLRSNPILLDHRNSNLVVQDILTFQNHISIRLRRYLAGALKGDVLTLNRNSAVLLQCDTGIAGLESDLVGRHDSKSLVNLEFVVPHNIRLSYAID